jgi:hypothetical protein
MALKPRQPVNNPGAAQPDRHASRQGRFGAAGCEDAGCRDRTPARSRHRCSPGPLAERVPAAAAPSPTPPPPHLPRHLLFRVLVYRLQADHWGDLDAESQRLLDGTGSPEDAGKRAVEGKQLTTDIPPGTMLAREWNGRMRRVAVLAEGFAWNGKTYRSLSAVAQAITGTRWNGPKFFGLRDKPSKDPQKP